MLIKKITNKIELENQFDVELQWPWQKTYGDNWSEADYVAMCGYPNKAGEISVSDVRSFLAENPGRSYCWYAA